MDMKIHKRDPDEFEELFNEGHERELDAFLTLLHPADIAELVTMIDRELWPALFAHLDDECASEVIEELPEPQLQQVLRIIDLPRLTAIVEEMDSDDAADLLADLPPKRAETILHALDDEDAEDLQQLLTYPEDCAGGIMQTEMASLPEGVTVAAAVTELKILHQEIEELHQVYVVDADGHFVGLVPVIRILFADPADRMSDIMEPAVVMVPPEMDQEDVARLFRKYDLVSVAVVDKSQLLLGRIVIDDIVDVLDEEASEDMLRFAGTSREDLVYGNRIFKIASRRLPWLVTNLFGGLLTGYLLSFFKLVVADALLLVSFVPVITAMGGNVGTQSATIVIRGFALGKIQMLNLSRTLLRELGVGLIMGVVCGLFVGVIARVWEGNIILSLVVGCAMICSMTVAALMGVLAPSFFKFIGTDPAIASGPFVTTANDVTGILIYLGVAALLFNWMGLGPI